MAKNKLDYPIYLFKEGTNCEAYKLFKLSYVARGGKKSWRFRCWAPRAKSVSVVGDFNGWAHGKNSMTPIGGGIWECCIAGLKKYDNYKFSIEGVDGVIRLKADPYALHSETPPANASKIYDLNGYRWNDEEYREKQKERNPYRSPMNIYEVHLGSWKRHGNGNFYSYTDLMNSLIPYVKEMGYTHIELLPITEYPFEGSWGYQIGSLFAPTSRFGTPHDFMAFVDACHQEGIGVLLDFVISHFPKDSFGLYEFDGAPLYEYEDPTKQEHKSWGTRVFDYGRNEVNSFLMSAAAFWLDYYHIDGLRLDAVASMLYLDYERKEGEWLPNTSGGNYNLEAVAFLQKLNKLLLTKYPHTLMIAEESTAFPMVTKPPQTGGLGFNFKWNMGWMNDILTYESIDPFFRKGSHDKLTFSLTYAFSENFILPFSHDEVVHGKASMISKMEGNYGEKFAALKALYVYQYTHPGKKLNFMGNEFGQFIEWDYRKELDWLLLGYESHAKLKEFSKALNKLYLEEKPLYELDDSPQGFRWIVVDDRAQNVIAYYRADSENNKNIVIISFSDVLRKNYSFGVPEAGKYKVIMNTNKKEFGGETAIKEEYQSTDAPMHGYNHSLTVDLEGNSALIFKLSKEDELC
ncbi:MAG: 1,4-alpha-glucan branching protein GlgB [Clostridia bacterium]|nr:1,4-alpha-glucan branching protein GlgB [Clostridia bacterium]